MPPFSHLTTRDLKLPFRVLADIIPLVKGTILENCSRKWVANKEITAGNIFIKANGNEMSECGNNGIKMNKIFETTPPKCKFSKFSKSWKLFRGSTGFLSLYTHFICLSISLIKQVLHVLQEYKNQWGKKVDGGRLYAPSAENLSFKLYPTFQGNKSYPFLNYISTENTIVNCCLSAK